MDRKELKISLSTFAIWTTIVLLFVAVIVVGIYMLMKSKSAEKEAIKRQNSLVDQIQETIEYQENKKHEVVNEYTTQTETEKKKDYIFLYEGNEISKKEQMEFIDEGMPINDENIKKYNTVYYNYKNGKFVGETEGIFGTEDTICFEGYSIVGNVEKIAVSENYNVIPRKATKIDQLPSKFSDIPDYTNVEIDSIDLDGDGQNEYILCWTIDYSEEEIEKDESLHVSSGIMLFDSNYNKIANLVDLDNGFWANIKTNAYKIFMSLDNVDYADIDNDGIMEIIIKIPAYEGFELGIYKYKNNKINGEIEHKASVQP